MFYGLYEERRIHKVLCCLSELPAQTERHGASEGENGRFRIRCAHVTLTVEGGEVLGTPAFVLSNTKCHTAQR